MIALYEIEIIEFTNWSLTDDTKTINAHYKNFYAIACQETNSIN